MTFACVDVDYRADGSAMAACVAFSDWTEAAPAFERTLRVAHVEPYVSGAFFRRELPCILAVLEATVLDGSVEPFDLVIVDGYVVLDGRGTPGLGAHLHAALGGSIAVVGVGKTRYAHAETAVPVLRGKSASPLWITALGMDPAIAATRVREMHGPHRIPTLLRRVDRLARDA